LQIETEGESFKILENEFMQFKADPPHSYMCVDEKMVSAIMQLSYRAYDQKGTVV
jgi:hypothetical protein